MDTNNRLAENLVYQRKLQGLTQKDLSDRTNVTVRTIQRIEKGETEPHLQTVKLLATALNVEVNDLLVLDDPKEENIQKKWLLLMHTTPFIGFIIPLANIFIPLFLWIHKREDNRLYNEHGRKVVNFQITISLLFALAVGMMLFGGHMIIGGGIWFYIILFIIPSAAVIMLVNIFMTLSRHKSFYPLSIPFIRKKRRDRKSSGNKIVSFLLLFFCFFGVGMSQEIERLDGSKIAVDSLEIKIEQLMTAANVTGLAISIFDENKLEYTNTFGYANKAEGRALNAKDNMYGASLSKAVFSVIVMKLVEKGIIDLDTPLESYLPKKIWKYEPQTKWHDHYYELKEDTLYHKITARMALAHTSGFPNWRHYEPDQKLKVKHEPGSRYLYSGEGMVYLQVVLEKITGKTLNELAQEHLFQPLGMTRSSYTWQPEFEKSIAYGHSEEEEVLKKDRDNEARAPSTLETTVEDFNKFLLAALNEKILSRNSWEEIFSPQIRIRAIKQFGPLALEDGPLNDDIELSYGLGWGWFKTPYGKGVFKEGGGSGFKHYSVLFPETGKGVLIMTNSFNSGGIFKELLEVAMKDIYTPWEWDDYIPYNMEE